MSANSWLDPVDDGFGTELAGGLPTLSWKDCALIALSALVLVTIVGLAG